MSAKDVLDVVAVPVVLALLALCWPSYQSFLRGRRFRLLAARELEELSPFPDQPAGQRSWKDHAKRGFVHRKIIEAPSENRDFILGLDPSFIYYLAQLWAAHEAADAAQWLYYMRCLADHRYCAGRRSTIAGAANRWERLIVAYGERELQT